MDTLTKRIAARHENRKDKDRSKTTPTLWLERAHTDKRRYACSKVLSK